MKKLLLLIGCCVSANVSAEKMEAQWFGTINAGVQYEKTPITESENFDVYSNEGSYIGIEAYSGFTSFYAKARLEIDVNPTAIGGVLSTRQGFVELGQGQGAYRLGSMMTLQGQLLATPVNIMNSSLSMKHLAVAEYSPIYKANLFQMQFPVKGLMSYYEMEMNGFTGAKSIGESDEDINNKNDGQSVDNYTFGLAMLSDEGKISFLKWHDNNEDQGYWAVNLDYHSAKFKLATSYLKKNDEEKSLDTAFAYLVGQSVWIKSSVHSKDFEETSMILGMDYIIGEQAALYIDYDRFFDQQGAFDLSIGLRLDF